jgi:hypothetical protein
MEHNTPNTPLVKKVTWGFFFLFFLLFLAYKPYERTVFIAHSTFENLYLLYHFVITQTLGIVHEGGHGICYLLGCPEFITALNGTVFQLLFPYLVGYYYKRRGNRLGYLIGIFFVGFSLQYTAWYMGTTYKGPVVSASESFLGVDGYHDFYKIFSILGVREYYKGISTLTHLLAYGIMVYSLFSMWLLAFFEGKKPKLRRR